ncbi:MAG: DNA mismatch repair protein MutS [Synergistaceae bacterium]|nr:DNA mismatch repair protein MutS [Synergistaceae bacterium]
MSKIPSDIKITPWLEQYKSFKEQFPDSLLLFRMGDFYEMFFDDARQASSALNIALTARDPEKKIPMAGIPHHALNSYLSRLIRAGYKAAICEQIGEANSKTLVERRVIRVVTPGTYLPDDSARDSAHLASVWPLKGRVAMALLYVDTGSLEAGTLSEREASAMLSAFAPGEVLFPSSLKHKPEFLNGYNLQPSSPENFKPENSAGRLKAALHAKSLSGFGIDERDPCVGTAWAALEYLSATQFTSMSNVLRISPLRISGQMSLDSSAQKNLELIPETTGDSISLFTCLDKNRTQMGKRTLRDWILRPLMDITAIERRQKTIGVLVDAAGECSKLLDALAGTRDVERALSRISLRNFNPQDLGAVRDTLRLIPEIRSIDADEPLKGIIDSLPDLQELSDYLNSALEDELPRSLGAGNVIRAGFDPELDNLRNIASDGENWLNEYVEKERAATATPKLKAGYTNAFGYYLEIGRGGLAIQPGYFKQTQTLVNAKRYTTPELKAFELRMQDSGAEIARLEAEAYNSVAERILAYSSQLQVTGRVLGLLDCCASFAGFARERNYVCPEVNTSAAIEIHGGRHPVIEAEQRDSGFVPNDATLGPDRRIIILTGPNMAGKSTWLRMTALLTIMAQAGLWVPADSAKIGLVDRVFTRIGARDDLVRGASTFMVEMLETANILRNATDKSLVVLDEVGRGTATYDGMSIAWAVLEYLQANTKARVLFATHYHELTCLEERLEGVRNCSMSVAEGREGIIFMHQVQEGPAGRSYGIEVARLAGVPDAVLRRAFELLQVFEDEGIESKNIPDPLPQNALKRQVMLFSPEADAIIEELRALDTDNITPKEALKILDRLKDKASEV